MDVTQFSSDSMRISENAGSQSAAASTTTTTSTTTIQQPKHVDKNLNDLGYIWPVHSYYTLYYTHTQVIITHKPHENICACT